MKKYILKNNQSPWLEEIYLRELGYKENGFFVEIGVGHSFFPEWDIYNNTGDLCTSNTGPLADIGWEGIDNPFRKIYYQECQERHKSNNVKIVNCAAGAENAQRVLGMGDTLRPEVRDNFYRLNWLTEEQRKNDYPDHTFQVQEREVMSVLKEQNCPKSFDLLSVDVEGYEKIIFSSLDLDFYNPKLIIVESRSEDPRFDQVFRQESKDVENIILSQGYKKIYSDILNIAFLKDS